MKFPKVAPGEWVTPRRKCYDCVFVDTPHGQMSWHFHDDDAHLFASLPVYDKPWDGHTTRQKYERLWDLIASTVAPWETVEIGLRHSSD